VLAIGIESGLYTSGVDARMYDVCVCSAFDGTSFNQGLSCAFEIPQPILRYVTEEGMDLAQACNAAGVTSNPQLGEAEGLIGILSKGRVTRLDYTKQAISMALLYFENKDLYQREGSRKGQLAQSNGGRDIADTETVQSSVITPSRVRQLTRRESKEDPEISDCISRLRYAAKGKSGVEFELPLTSFQSAFVEADAQPNCTYSVKANGKHTVHVDGRCAVEAVLGDSLVTAAIEGFTLQHDGACTATLHTKIAKGQSSLADTWENGSRPSTQDLAAAAAKVAAADSERDPFVVESDEDGSPLRKRQRTIA